MSQDKAPAAGPSAKGVPDAGRFTTRVLGASEDRSVVAGQFAEVAPGLRLHYASCGDRSRPLMLLLHGFPEFWGAWREIMPSFADRFHVVAPDLRGYNLSDKPEDVDAYRPSVLVADVVGLIQALGHERCVLVAHDWGGAIAWSVAITHPELIERLVILNAPHPVPFARDLAGDPAQQKASSYMNRLRAQGSEVRLAENDLVRLDGFFLNFGGQNWFDAETRSAYHAAWSQAGALRAGVNWYRASPLYPPIGEDRGAGKLQLDPAIFVVRVPTLVIWGEGDTALLPGLLDGLETVVPELRIVRIPDASHWLIHEQPERVVSEIRSFIADGA
jgi:pimeloyl-ACP methyl ester carboxylesterase